RAEQSQKRHLEALFNRYGENGTISLDGLKRLLQSVGLDRIRTVMVQHHEQLGHRHHHHHHHHHHHDDHLPDNNNSHHQKHVHAEPSRPGKFPKSVENRDVAMFVFFYLQCLNASSILSSHGMSQEVAVTLGDFRYLCPALLNQIDFGCVGRVCVAAWAGGFISITIISLLSLLGVVLIPLMNRVFFKFLLSFLVALAVGTLSGDAFLHLIPHVSRSAALEVRSLVSSVLLYFMFLIEHFLTLGKMYKDKNKKQKVRASSVSSRCSGV
uniref:Zinc transporter ZIP6 n=1 Tax=Scophthalmus maximus TaxID=52904 RepID=A0A8D3DPV0_SCOMX